MTFYIPLENCLLCQWMEQCKQERTNIDSNRNWFIFILRTLSPDQINFVIQNVTTWVLRWMNVRCPMISYECIECNYHVNVIRFIFDLLHKICWWLSSSSPNSKLTHTQTYSTTITWIRYENMTHVWNMTGLYKAFTETLQHCSMGWANGLY